MTAHTFRSASLICIEKSRCAALTRTMGAETHAEHGTEFHSGMHRTRITGGDEILAKGRLQVLPARNQRVLCLSGELWLTRDGDIEDYILGPGQQLVVRAGDRATVQALQPSRFRLTAD